MIYTEIFQEMYQKGFHSVLLYRVHLLCFVDAGDCAPFSQNFSLLCQLSDQAAPERFRHTTSCRYSQHSHWIHGPWWLLWRKHIRLEKAGLVRMRGWTCAVCGCHATKWGRRWLRGKLKRSCMFLSTCVAGGPGHKGAMLPPPRWSESINPKKTWGVFHKDLSALRVMLKS